MFIQKDQENTLVDLGTQNRWQYKKVYSRYKKPDFSSDLRKLSQSDTVKLLANPSDLRKRKTSVNIFPDIGVHKQPLKKNISKISPEEFKETSPHDDEFKRQKYFDKEYLDNYQRTKDMLLPRKFKRIKK
mmetsp:Transcript_40/g.75  ORF Transcript_40/g.75 Transcript_40/m.75 type:complete len:130 (-) Transcript_40:30-419(-)